MKLDVHVPIYDSVTWKELHLEQDLNGFQALRVFEYFVIINI